MTVQWAHYQGLSEGYRRSMQDAFMTANPQIQLKIVDTSWDLMHEKLMSSIARGKPPELSIIDNRWLLELADLDAAVEVTKYVTRQTIDSITPSALEASIKGRMLALPIGASARLLAFNSRFTYLAPASLEELRAEAIRVHNPPQVFGLIMPGKKYGEPGDFCYYLYSAGGDFFARNQDGSFGECTVNSPAGVKALQFMVELANKDRVVQEGYLEMDRTEAQQVFCKGRAAYVMTGAWIESWLKKAGADFEVRYGTIPPFAGQKQSGLIITDSIAMLKGAEYQQEAGLFLDFFYQNQWKADFDEQVGFMPITVAAMNRPRFQTPLYRTLVQASLGAKSWPLIKEWPEATRIIWDANLKAFLGQMSAKEALDEAAARIDRARGL